VPSLVTVVSAVSVFIVRTNKHTDRQTERMDVRYNHADSSRVSKDDCQPDKTTLT